MVSLLTLPKRLSLKLASSRAEPFFRRSEGSRSYLLILPIPNIGEVPRNRRRRRHHRTDKMRPPSAPLPSFKIAVAGRSAAFARLQNVWIHSQAHRASRLAPLESRVLKNPVQAFLFGRPLHRLRSRHHHRPHFRTYGMSLRHARRRTQIFNPRICARSDEHPIDPDIFNPPPRLEPHVLQSEFRRAPIRFLQSV